MRTAALEGRTFALAVLDMILPGINGLDLARRIKADATIGSTQLVMLTSVSWKADSQTARNAGIAEFLNKPIRRSELLDAIRRSFQAPVEKTETSPPSMIDAAGGRGILHGVRVLVAEDNPVNQEVIREFAGQLGCEPLIAENGRIAVEAFATAAFDVVLMDCQMPEMDGLTACRKMREIERSRGLSRTPVIAVTANAYESDRAMCLAAEMDDFMSKPFTEQQLSDVLSRWVRQGKAQSSPVGTATAQPTRDAVEIHKLATLDPAALQAFERQKPGMAARLSDLFLSTAPNPSYSPNLRM
jgi:CheY-like chemotaxis protein